MLRHFLLDEGPVPVVIVTGTDIYNNAVRRIERFYGKKFGQDEQQALIQIGQAVVLLSRWQPQSYRNE